MNAGAKARSPSIAGLPALSLPAIALCLTISSALAEGFRDPLDHPARMQTNLAEKPLLSVSFAGDRLVAVGARGLVATSDDGGKTWQQSEVPVQTDLVAVHFPTPEKGWAVGHDGVILYSMDGGRAWEKRLDGRQAETQFVRHYEERVAAGEAGLTDILDLTLLNYADGPSLPYMDVEFLDEREGWVVGAFGQAARTGDGGRTWLPALHLIDNDPPLLLYDMERIGENLYIGSERGTVYKWTPGSGRFEIRETGYEGTFLGVTGNESVVLAFGLVGTVYRSEDEGATWQPVELPTESTVNAAARLADGAGFAFVTQNGELLVADRLARHFRLIQTRAAMPLTDVAALADGKALILGLGGVRRIDLPLPAGAGEPAPEGS